MLAIVDSYVAMTSDRPYRRALSAREALAQIRAGAGSRYDPNLVESFIRLHESQVTRSLPPDDPGRDRGDGSGHGPGVGRAANQ